MIVHIAGSNNTIADALSCFQATRFYQLAPLAAPHPDNILEWPTQFWTDSLHEYQSLGVAPSTRHTYGAGVRSYQQFCNQFNIQQFPATSLTLRYFCTSIAQHVSYKTIKVYLVGIRLEHLERGLHDPTDDKFLHLLCTGIKWSQGTTSRTRLPITIDLLRSLKS